MLLHLSSNLAPAIFFDVEPVANDHHWSQTTESFPHSEDLSFSQKYNARFEANVFKFLRQWSIEFDS